MKFGKVKRYPGGALGNITRAIAEIQASLEQLKAVYPIHLRPQGNSATIEFTGDRGGSSEGPYAFRITARPALDVDGLRIEGKYTVTVLGGTAQTFGGSVKTYENTTLNEVPDGEYIYLRYQNVDGDYEEVGEWDTDIHHGDETELAGFSPPQDLVFSLGRIDSSLFNAVRQDHKGNVVMPAISNVVDIQTALP